MNTRTTTILLAMASLFGIVPSAMAYVGPGAGLTLVGSFIGLCLTLLVALWAVLSWPIRRLLKRRKQGAAGNEKAPEMDQAHDSPPS
ncbi:MAG: hypothetical protein WCL49_01620 [bacterium]